jgi:hypothetical protein
MLSVRDCSRKLGVTHCNILHRIFAGEFRRVARNGSSILNDYFVSLAEETDTSAACVTSTAAAAILDVRSGVITALLKEGILPYDDVKSSSNRFTKRMIPKAEIDALAARFVTIGQLVRASGLDRNLINGRMRRLKIASGFEGKSLGAKFIRRDDVPRILATTSTRLRS